MKRSQPPNPFELENLEQRVMLSGDPLVGGLQAIAPDELDPFAGHVETPPLEESLISGDDTSQDPTPQKSTPYDPSQNLSDIFSGLTEEDPFADQEGDAISQEALALSDHLINETEKEAIIRGLDEVAKLGRLLEDFDAFAAPLPLMKNAHPGQTSRTP